jgi:hypothetical protein
MAVVSISIPGRVNNGGNIMNTGILVTILGSIAVFLLVSLTSLLPLLIIGGIVWYVYIQIKKARTVKQASRTWPSTTGKIAKSRVELAGGRDMATVEHRIIYEYQVGGRQYQCDQIHPGDKFFEMASKEETYDLVDRYPVGRDVTVYYNPDNPAEAALEV